MRLYPCFSVGIGITCAFLIGCEGSAGGPGGGSPAPVCTAPADPAVFELGTGAGCFERLTPGQTVPVMNGPQGGFHLWTGLGCADCGSSATVEFGTQDVTTKAWLYGDPQKQVVDLGQGAWAQHAGLTAFLPGDVNVDQASQLPKGTHVILSLRVLGQDTAELHAATVELILGDVDINPACSDSESCGMSGYSPCCVKDNL